ncbi:MAG: PH domain-containing protein [Thermoproteota archaeon]
MIIKINERFKPDSVLAMAKCICFLWGAVLAVAIWIVAIPLASSSTAVVYGIPFMPIWISLMQAIRIRLYYSSLFYTFTEKEIIIEKGLRKQNIIVPYDSVINVYTRQKPLSRILGLWYIHVQTTGYPYVLGGREVGRVVLEGIRNPEEVRSFILKKAEEVKRRE